MLRRGLSLVEVLVVMIILAALAATLYPTVAGQLRSGQATALGDQLGHVRDAIDQFRQNVGEYPSSLTQLTTPLAAGATNSCGVAIGATARNRWRGPYLSRAISGPLQVGAAAIQPGITRTLIANPVANLRIDATAVDSTVAADIEREFDGPTPNYAAGTVLWSAAGGGTLGFNIVTRGC